MQVLSVSKARESLYHLVKEKTPVRVQHKNGNVMLLIPEEEYEAMERELFTQRMERSIRKGKRLSQEEAEIRLAQMLKNG